MADEISVVICAYTEKRWLCLVEAVQSVQKQTVSVKELIVVVDHNQSLLERVQRDLPEIVVIENREERGLSGARNTGIAAACGRIVAFLDDDAIAAPDWLAVLDEMLDRAEVLGVGGLVTPLWVARKPLWLPEEFYWVVGCTYRGVPEVVSRIRNPIGANMAFRREVFEGVGGFREGMGRIGTLPLGCEETELCIRANQRWPHRYFWYQPAALVSHYVPETRTTWRYFFSRCYSEGISKAFVACYVGAKDGLASERAYSLRILPLGVIQGLRDGFLKHQLSGFVRAWAIIVGLSVTATGYLIGSMMFHLGRFGRNAASVSYRNAGSSPITRRVG